MVMNVGLAIAGAMREVEEDIRSVKAVCQDIPLKVILECHYLNDAQICLSTEACLRAGADWIKTGTGWAPTGATCENVALIKQTVGDRARVKAAGGIRDLNTLLEMHRLGAERFGIGLRTVQTIFDAARHKNDSGERLFAEPDH
jgi:deoxyribose-phosphate aldolase